MANNQWDRTLINTRERPVSSDINQAQSQLDRSIRETLMQFFRGRVSGLSDLMGSPMSGFLGDGLKVRVNSGLSVKVTAGLGFLDLGSDVPSAVGGVSAADDLSRYKPMVLLADAFLNSIPAGPSAGNTRTDIVEARMSRVVGNPTSRDVLNTSTGLFESTAVNKTLAFTLDGSVGQVTSPADSTAAISYKVGVVNGAEPSVTAGYVKLATIYASAGNMTAAVAHANIADQRNILVPNGTLAFGVSFSVPTGSGGGTQPTSVSFVGPAGVECVVTKDAAPANSQFSVWVFGGPVTNARGTMVGNVTRAFSASDTFVLQNLGTTFGTVDAGMATTLADAGLTGGPAIGFPIGTPFMRTKFGGYRIAASVIDNSLPNPAIVEVSGVIQRY